jgi:hypothetical protein
MSNKNEINYFDVKFSLSNYLHFTSKTSRCSINQKLKVARTLIEYFEIYISSNEAAVGRHLDKPLTINIPDSVSILYHHVTDARKLIKESNLEDNQPF